jgi:hypothetical protein
VQYTAKTSGQEDEKASQGEEAKPEAEKKPDAGKAEENKSAAPAETSGKKE